MRVVFHHGVGSQVFTDSPFVTISNPIYQNKAKKLLFALLHRASWRTQFYLSLSNERVGLRKRTLNKLYVLFHEPLLPRISPIFSYIIMGLASLQGVLGVIIQIMDQELYPCMAKKRCFFCYTWHEMQRRKPNNRFMKLLALLYPSLSFYWWVPILLFKIHSFVLNHLHNQILFCKIPY